MEASFWLVARWGKKENQKSEVYHLVCLCFDFFLMQVAVHCTISLHFWKIIFRIGCNRKCPLGRRMYWRYSVFIKSFCNNRRTVSRLPSVAVAHYQTRPVCCRTHFKGRQHTVYFENFHHSLVDDSRFPFQARSLITSLFFIQNIYAFASSGNWYRNSTWKRSPTKP